MNTLELIGIAVGIVATVLAGVWFILSRVFGFGKFSQRIEEIDSRTCKAACELHDRDIDSIKDSLKNVSDNIVKITSLLLLKYKDASKLFSVKNSPRQLNEFGKKVFGDIEGNEFLQANKEFLFAQIDVYNPQTALDVENAAHAACLVSADNEIFNRIKSIVYNSPSYKVKDVDGKEKDYDLTLPDVCFVLSVPLRDMYLKEHTEITL